MTNFIHAKVQVGPDLYFTVDGNSKITAGNGTYLEPKPNALSLPHISCCPGSTETCRKTCYVHGLKQHAPDVYEAYRDNERVLHRVLMSERSADLASRLLGEWIKKNCVGGFRWHVSGDVLHQRHACWIKDVCSVAYPVKCWIYTRSLTLIPILAGQSNLVVNVSADKDNWPEAYATAEKQGLRVCYETVDGTLPELPPGSVVFPDYSLRGRNLPDPKEAPWWQQLLPEQRRMVCPADFFEQSEHVRCGVCRKCMK